MADQASKPAAPEGSIKETLISLIISFVMALVFRSYVVEAFIIPTGSMAPTLLGAHMQFRSPETGSTWTVNPWYEAGFETPMNPQGSGPWGAPSATDPMSTGRVNMIREGSQPRTTSGYTTPARSTPLRAGDRILVQKYLYELFPPKRFDVVVFKNPEFSTQNFIKRLIGLPNEQVWIADGDIFTRTYEKDADGKVTTGPWQIQRKPRRLQDSLWRPIFSSEYTPLNPERDGRRWFSSPWKGSGWKTEDRLIYEYDSAEPTVLAWDSESWPITDWVPYNEYPGKIGAPYFNQLELFPVADLRMKAGIEPAQPGLHATATIESHGHEFQAELHNGAAILRMRSIGTDEVMATEWKEVARGTIPEFVPGRVVVAEFSRVDQALELRVNDEIIVRYEDINWGPSERLLYATGLPGDEYTGITRATNQLRLADTYALARPKVSWSFRGSPLKLHRVGIDRDVYYEATQFNMGGPGLGTHPKTLATLGPEQFFVLGDNSPSSKDGRLWDVVDPWVSAEIDGTVGVVPRKLLLGKAFFVYFPAPSSAFGNIPIPDIGRMRFIR